MESNVWSLSEVDYPKSNRQARLQREWFLGKTLFIAIVNF
jgi:hypothetical protein